MLGLVMPGLRPGNIAYVGWWVPDPETRAKMRGCTGRLGARNVTRHHSGMITIHLKYEIDADNPLPGMKQSFAYMRGVLAGLD